MTPDEKKKKLFDDLNTLILNAEMSVPEKTWRATSMEDYKFYAGDQDDKAVLAELAHLKRPNTTYNEVKPKIDMLIGLAAQMRQIPMLAPVGFEDEPLVELMNSTYIHFRKKLKLTRKENECFQHTAKGGRSFLYFYMDNENPFKPQIKAKRLAGYDVWVDPNSVEYDLSDARIIFFNRWLTAEEIEALWGKEELGMIQQTANNADLPTYYDINLDKYRVCEVWFRKLERVIWYINPFTQKHEWLLPEEFAEMNKGMKEGFELPNGELFQLEEGLSHVESHRKNIYYAILSGSKVLEYDSTPYKHDHFPVVQCGAYKDDDKNAWFSAVTMMKDPQRGINTMRRQLQHLLQTAPKGILMHEVGAVLNIEEYEERSSDPTYHMEVAQGKLDKVKFSDQPQISPIYQSLDGIYTQSMKDASGI